MDPTIKGLGARSTAIKRPRHPAAWPCSVHKAYKSSIDCYRWHGSLQSDAKSPAQGRRFGYLTKIAIRINAQGPRGRGSHWAKRSDLCP